MGPTPPNVTMTRISGLCVDTHKPDGSTDVAHTARSFVVDDQGNVVVEWSFGTGADVMASDLQLLLDQQDEDS